jgi:dTDP-4-amino-4,6-dideoxy-D-galactose acyltransferase
LKIHKLNWDSDFFGFNIAELDLGKKVGDFKKIDQYAKTNKIKLVQCLIKTTNIKLINLLQDNDYDFADLRTTFIIEGRPPLPETEDKTIREATEDDIKYLKEIAGNIFYETSRYKHKKISKARAKKLYATWVEKAILKTFDDVCYVKIHQGKIAGFVTYKSRNRKGIVGLIGITSEERGLGIGSTLLKKCFARSFDEGNDVVEVVTGGTNIPALNFYFKNGFKITKMESWYYKWF